MGSGITESKVAVKGQGSLNLGAGLSLASREAMSLPMADVVLMTAALHTQAGFGIS
jgi:hypothetical protein